jgi:hypothetical protein
MNIQTISKSFNFNNVLRFCKHTNTLPELVKNIQNIKTHPSDSVYRTCLANYYGKDYSSFIGKEYPNDDQVVINRNTTHNIQLILGILRPNTCLYYNNPRHIKVLDGPIDIEFNKTGDCSRFEFRDGAITIANSHYVYNDSNQYKSFLWIDSICNNDIPLL